MLEFLLLLSRRPRLTQKLMNEDFEKVFKLLLHFTDPKRPIYSLVYQVLAYWFIVSPLPQRPLYFTMISKSLYQNIKERGDLLAEAHIDLVSIDGYL